MKIRDFQESDIPEIKRIYHSYYEDIEEIDFDKILCAFTVLDDNGAIITVGGLRPSVEMVALTDKEQSARNKVGALLELRDACIHSAYLNNYDEIQVFTSRLGWVKNLLRAGFRPIMDKVLSIGVRHG